MLLCACLRHVLSDIRANMLFYWRWTDGTCCAIASPQVVDSCGSSSIAGPSLSAGISVAGAAREHTRLGPCNHSMAPGPHWGKVPVLEDTFCCKYSAW